MIPAYMKSQTTSDTAISQKAASRARTWQGASIAAALWRSFLDDRHDLRSDAQAIRVRTLIIWGSKDIIFPVDIAHLVHRSIPGSQLEIFESGYVVFSCKPDEFLNVVNGFLQ
jgi:pimeloyl-ACP methyl ester carboxylesterase